MEEYYKEEIERLKRENTKLHELVFKQSEELVQLRNENLYLHKCIQGKVLSEKEQQLLRVAKSIIHELDQEVSK